MQLGYDKNDQNVELTFANIGEHAYWASSADNDSFTAKLDAGEFDWAEIATASFEVHSQLNKMRNSIGGTWATAADLAQATETYTHNYPHVLAGFQGPGIDKVDEIHNFAQVNGWEVPVLDLVKHMNADQATCGAGCSGNPYDAYWAFGPTSHGDIHELGHGLEKSKFRFAGWDGHASTNPYSYYSKSKYAAATNTSSSCQSLPSSEMFETLHLSLRQSDPFAYMQAANLTSWSQGVAIYIQMMMAAQEQGALIDGWHLLARLHLLLNEYNKADDNETQWLDKRNTIGFGSMSLSTAKALNNNDWLAISIAYVTGYNYSDFLTMWGLPISNETQSFILSQGYPMMPLKFYQTSGNDYCEGLDKPAVPISDRDNDGYIDAYDAFPDDPAEHADADGDGLGDNADTQYDLNPAEMDYHNVEIQRTNNSAVCIGVDDTPPLPNKQLKAVTCSQAGSNMWSWGQDGRIHLQAEPSLCIQASGYNNNASLTLKTCSSADTQKWSYNLGENSIRNRVNSGAAFDLFSGGDINIWGAHGGVNQQWLIVTP
ncbi:RICIN domain-containing protein [Alkalimarinus sediminis]|uniref:RICIN domain-containing protein n=1 Tax=Alkalimarinus sediminis TaxID=1632866 RepID=A0A9E8KS16_9ALTE|nr:RICIN domain-containing protein [Alkalimarinus sediminis]